MLLKSVALAASVIGVLATAPAASAATPQASGDFWGPGNCPQGMFCVWPNWNHPPEGPTETPSLVTDSDWSGRVPAFNYYNRTSRNAELTWSYNYLGSDLSGTVCAPPGEGNLYVPMYVTKLSWQPRTC
ncbi:hypothetical protein [Micromonospora cathayae]|uniref:Peptidase inhibitor family I36 n=1 Tax=Micromonospora cathayae TaxID=3028804 RepID=A0ABY7ZM82_9ACTN|nr:hypothetical protein [Micromonospora sp. HUAS 3]WDZ84096.1 hypothetical protein PVK37_27130 [Micromonospora sp. HUAS 3]